MTHFPNSIEIQLIDNKHNQPIQGIVLLLHLFANHKNDYHILTNYSNEEGKVIVTKEFLEDEINKTRNMFIMDHSSSLPDCKPSFEIEVLDDKQIKQKIDGIKKHIPKGHHEGIPFCDACLQSIKKLQGSKNYKVRNKKLIVDVKQSAERHKVLLRVILYAK